MKCLSCVVFLTPQGVVLIHGARIGYFQGDIRALMDDLTTLKPTIFPVVPRLLNRMFDKVCTQTHSYFRLAQRSTCLD